MYYGLIYLTTNIVNGMQYIGQTTKPEHVPYFGSGVAILADLAKFGSKSFKRETLCCCSNKKDLAYMERQFIQQFNAVESDQFYNISKGGHQTNGSAGYKHTQEHRDHIRQIMLERHPMKGKTFGPEMRRRVSEANKGRKGSERQRETARNYPHPTLTCPSCGKEGKGGGMIRFHFNNCKSNRSS